MALQYKLEYIFGGDGPSDDSVFIQLRVNPPTYQSWIDKETYDVQDTEDKHDFLTGLFNIAGVTELSSKAYRLWIMKSPVYSWEEVLAPTLSFIKDWYSETTLEELPGSGKIDGTGTRLSDTDNRRSR